MLLLVLDINGCTFVDNHDYQHVKFFSRNDWTIKEFIEKTDYQAGSISHSNFNVNRIKLEGKVDVVPYQDKQITVTTYRLNETIGTYNYVTGTILDSEGNILGSYLQLNHEYLLGNMSGDKNIHVFGAALRGCFVLCMQVLVLSPGQELACFPDLGQVHTWIAECVL
jgi:hypothetical protein